MFFKASVAAVMERIIELYLALKSLADLPVNSMISVSSLICDETSSHARQAFNDSLIAVEVT